MKQLIDLFGPEASDEEIVAAIKRSVEVDRRGKVAETLAKHYGPKSHTSGTDQSSHGIRGGASDTTTPSATPGDTAPPRTSIPDQVVYSEERTEAPGEDPTLVRQVTYDMLTQHGQRLNYIAEVAGEQFISEPGLKKGIDTMGMYGRWEGTDFKGFSAERILWHKDLLLQMEAEQIAANDGIVPSATKKAVIMAGLPGSGKTHVLERVLGQEVIDLREYVLVNPDRISEKIIFEDTPPVIEDLEGGELTTLVHEEAAQIVRTWQESLEARGLNVAYDTSGAKLAKTRAKIEAMTAKGYTVDIVHVDVSIDEAIASTLKRASETGLTPGKLGRPVPKEVILRMQSETGGDVINENMADYVNIANGRVWEFRNYPLTRQQPRLTLYAQERGL